MSPLRTDDDHHLCNDNDEDEDCDDDADDVGIRKTVSWAPSDILALALPLGPCPPCGPLVGTDDNQDTYDNNEEDEDYGDDDDDSYNNEDDD